MRHLLLALPFALLPLAQAAHSAQPTPTQHASLGPHEHGVARLNAVLDGSSLALELESPAMNIVGFEHAANSDADKTTLAAARATLQKPLWLFNLPAAAKCNVADQGVESALFTDQPVSELEGDDDDDDHADKPGATEAEHHHADIDAHYTLTCSNPGALKSLDLTRFFSTFPATRKIQAQLIGPNGQQGADVLPDDAHLSL